VGKDQILLEKGGVEGIMSDVRIYFNWDTGHY
jgi:hypothetical protein